MKAVFYSYNQALTDRVNRILDEQGIRGFTRWALTEGRGSFDGEPHYGTHAWPSMNTSLLPSASWTPRRTCRARAPSCGTWSRRCNRPGAFPPAAPDRVPHGGKKPGGKRNIFERSEALRTFFRTFVRMKLTFLGTGTSQGVPVIGCRCAVCTSQDPRDNRLRTAAMVETRDARIVIDAGPDFRQQMLRTGVRRIDAILLTHEHKDHTGGLDDVRAFNFVDYPTVRSVDIYGTARTLDVVRKDFDYAFAADKYRGVPELTLRTIDPSEPFRAAGTRIVPVAGHHSPRFEVTGYRIGSLGYLTDFKTIDPAEERKLHGVEVLVVNALRFAPHDSHFDVEEALELIRRIGPREAYLTHMSHEIGLHAEAALRLPPRVHPAWDTLQIEIPDAPEPTDDRKQANDPI